MARTNRPARNKPYGLVVDYVALADHLDEALAEYDLSDLEGMREELIAYELPLLEEHAANLRTVLDDLEAGRVLSDTEVQERLLERLEDQELRSRFDAAAQAFLTAVDRLMPRPEVGRPRFAGSGFLQEGLRKELRQKVVELLGVSRDVARPIAAELLATVVPTQGEGFRA